MKPFNVFFDVLEGKMNLLGNKTVRRYNDIKGIFCEIDPKLEKENPVIYEVFEAPITEKEGDLMFLITVLYPGKVKNEFFMTKGHYHVIENTAEIYLGLRGNGLVLCQTREGDFEPIEISPNKVVYIPPYWAHRTVNTSSEPLVFFGVYPAHAGHDYKSVELEGFKKRVFFENGGIHIK
ncbi:glucose-6-phosphate isomerase family protein [Thermotoga profunda]|uniref:glucose-6-phosphate isomerase family protein n=1 Tax=Thermotoga profunda TaxID=1508420 RepID=UPI0005972DC7|nr:glucose-6-phosphate isomerase family protein [Thermotoga profunda]